MLFLIETILVGGATAAAVAATARARRRAVLSCGAAAFALALGLNSFVVVKQESVAVETLFGRTLPGYAAPGIGWANPFSSYKRYVALRREEVVKAEVRSADGVPLEVEVALATKLNPETLAEVRRKASVDHYNDIVVPAGLTAVRDGFAAVGWEEAASGPSAAVGEAIGASFAATLRAQFASAGMSAEDAAAAIKSFPVQVRSVRIADGPTAAKQADRAYEAAEETRRNAFLERQAAAAAARRSTDGIGLADFLSKLPAGTSVADAARLVTAEASRIRAEAAARASETGKVGALTIGEGAVQAFAPATAPGG
jgi:regulator of protease activity HflC (stomatin/prohibitin superfamily)